MHIYEHRNLNNEGDIVAHFKDYGNDFFDCGQGYSQEEAEVYTKIGNEYFAVNILADIESAKQDVGDRLYWVSDITHVSYEKLDEATVKVICNEYTNNQIAYHQQKIDKLKEQLL